MKNPNFPQKNQILPKNPNLMQKIQILRRKSKFLERKSKFYAKFYAITNPNFTQKSKFYAKIKILRKTQNFTQKSKFYAKNPHFTQKSKCYAKKSKFYAEHPNFTQNIQILRKKSKYCLKYKLLQYTIFNSSVLQCGNCRWESNYNFLISALGAISSIDTSFDFGLLINVFKFTFRLRFSATIGRCCGINSKIVVSHISNSNFVKCSDLPNDGTFGKSVTVNRPNDVFRIFKNALEHHVVVNFCVGIRQRLIGIKYYDPKFWSKIQIVFKNPNFGQTSKFGSKIQIAVENPNCGQKFKFGSKIEILLKKSKFRTQIKILVKKRNCWSEIEIYDKFQLFRKL